MNSRRKTITHGNALSILLSTVGVAGCSGTSTGDGSETDVADTETSNGGTSDGETRDGETRDGDAGDGNPDGCTQVADCEGSLTPFCDVELGKCVACYQTIDPDASCAELTPLTPVCVGGICVECSVGKDEVCTGSTPICDDTSNTCAGCVAHEQCGATACNLATGNCIGSDAMFFVDGDDPNCDDDGDGQPTTPFCSLDAALDTPAAEKLIIVEETLNGYSGSFVVADDVALFAAPYDEPRVRTFNNAAVLTVSGNLFMRGMSLSYSGYPTLGLVVDGGNAWIEQSKIVNNSGGGILVDGGGSLVLTNSFVGGSADSPALRVNDGTFELLYVTVGLPPSVGGPALECTDGSSSMMRNSLITSVHADPEVDCPNLSVSTSALEMFLGDNVSLGDMDVGWFDGYLAGDYHLSGTHPPAIDTAATWLSGDPTTDIDGDPRPTTDQSPDVAGADIP
jgi:hypothetical protein